MTGCVFFSNVRLLIFPSFGQLVGDERSCWEKERRDWIGHCDDSVEDLDPRKGAILEARPFRRMELSSGAGSSPNKSLAGTILEQWLLDPALYLDEYLVMSHLVCALVGIPANLLVAAVVLGWERLHLQRNFAWLGVLFSNVFVLAFNAAEVVAALWPSPVVGQICSLTNGLPCPALVLSYFFSLLDRHLCLKHAKWYKRHVTSCWTVLAAQLGSFVILCLVIKGRHLFGSAPIRWQSGPADLTVLGSCFLAGFVLCLAGQAAVWTTSRRDYPSAVADHRHHATSLAKDPAEEEEIDDDDDQQGPARSSPFVRIGEERISRLDLEAARTATTSVLIFMGFFIPSLISLALLVSCVHHQPGDDEDVDGGEAADCSHWGRIFFRSRGIIPIHCASISPFILVILSRDVRAALRDKLWQPAAHLSKSLLFWRSADGRKKVPLPAEDMSPTIPLSLSTNTFATDIVMTSAV